MPNSFNQLNPNIIDNFMLRTPQHIGFESIQDHFAESSAESEIGIVLPVGCGKSGLITVVPFATGSKRVLS